MKLVSVLTIVLAACQTSSGGVLTSVADDETAVILITTGATSLSTLAGVATTLNDDTSSGSTLVSDQRTIAIDLARGNGTTIDDFAAELGLPAGLVPRLGEILRRHRDQLVTVLDAPLYRETWHRRLADAACCDPWLYPFGRERFHCRPGGEGLVACVP